MNKMDSQSSQTVEVATTSSIKWNKNVWYLLTHYGDIEHITIIVDKKMNESGKYLLEVVYTNSMIDAMEVLAQFELEQPLDESDRWLEQLKEIGLSINQDEWQRDQLGQCEDGSIKSDYIHYQKRWLPSDWNNSM